MLFYTLYSTLTMVLIVQCEGKNWPHCTSWKHYILQKIMDNYKFVVITLPPHIDILKKSMRMKFWILYANIPFYEYEFTLHAAISSPSSFAICKVQILMEHLVMYLHKACLMLGLCHLLQWKTRFSSTNTQTKGTRFILPTGRGLLRKMCARMNSWVDSEMTLKTKDDCQNNTSCLWELVCGERGYAFGENGNVLVHFFW